MTEVWKAIPGYEGIYDISSEGRVRSLDRVVPYANGHDRPVKGRMLRPGLSGNGYYTVTLGRGGGSHCIHELIAAAFLGPRPPGHDVRHKNDVRAESRLDNLEYGTRGDNIRDAVRNGSWWSPKRLASLGARL